MKTGLTIWIILISWAANATHWLTYHVYIETEYVQGPWTKLEVLDQYNNTYLAPHTYEGLFGSEDLDFVEAIVSKLKEQVPERYDWTYHLNISVDTVFFALQSKPNQFKSIKNELTASLILNSFEAVVFQFPDQKMVSTLNDLSLPYLDLVVIHEPKSVVNDTTPNKSLAIAKNKEPELYDTTSREKAQPSYVWFWLSLSLLFNLIMIILFINKRKQ